jgi:hypothetical protein
MRALLTAAVLLLCPAFAVCQTIIAEAQIPEEYRMALTVQVVEADGDPATVELLATRPDGKQSVGRVGCAGPWIYPGADPVQSFFSLTTVVQIHGRHYWLVRDFQSPRVILKQMDAPTCGEGVN